MELTYTVEIVMANWRCKNIKHIVPRSRFAAKVKPLQRQSDTLIIICTHKLMCKYIIKYSIKETLKYRMASLFSIKFQADLFCNHFNGILF